MTIPQDKPVIEQVDREAAKELWRPFGEASGYFFNCRDDGLIIQAFARHRLAERERCAARFEQAIERGYPTSGNMRDRCQHGHFGWEDCIACYDDALCREIAAIRTGRE